MVFERKKNNKLEKDYNELQDQHKDRTKCSIDSEKEIQNLKTKLKTVSHDLEEKTRQHEDLNSSCEEKNSVIGRLREELDKVNGLLKEKIISTETQFSKNIQNLEMKFSARNFDYEQSIEKTQQLQTYISQLEKDLEETKKALKSDCKIESHSEERYKSEADSLRKAIKEISEKLYQTRKESAINLSEKELILNELQIRIKYEHAENERLRNELNTTITELMAHQENGRERHKRQIASQHFQISELINRFVATSEQFANCQILTTQLENEICTKNDMIEKIRMEYSIYEKTVHEQKVYITKLLSELKAAEMRSVEWQSKFSMAQQTIAELTRLKEQLETQISEILNSSKDINQQLASLMEDLRKTRAESEQIRIDLSQKLETAVKTEQEIRFKYQKHSEQFILEKSELESRLKLLTEAESTLKINCEKSISESLKQQEILQTQIREQNVLIETSKVEFNKQLQTANERVSHFEMMIQQLNTEKEKINQQFTTRIEHMSQEITHLKEIVTEKSKLVIETEEKLNQHKIEASDMSKRDKMSFEQQITQLMTEINNYKQIIQDTNVSFEKATTEINQYKTAQHHFEQQLQEEQQKIVAITNEKSRCESMYTETKNVLTQSESRITELTTQITQISQEKEQLSSVIQENNVQIQQLNIHVTQLQTEYNNIQNVIHEKEQNMVVLTKQLHEVQTQKESMNNVLMERENKIIALASQMEDVQKERGTTSQIFQKQEKQLVDLKVELQRASQEKEQINNYIVQKDTQIADLTHQLNVKVEEIKHITVEKEREISLVKEQIHQVEEQKEKVLNNLQQREEQMLVLNSNLQELNTEKVILENRAKEHEHNFILVKEELQKTGDCKVAAEAVTKEMEQKLQEKEQSISVLHEQVTKLKQQWEQPTSNPIGKTYLHYIYFLIFINTFPFSSSNRCTIRRER